MINQYMNHYFARSTADDSGSSPDIFFRALWFRKIEMTNIVIGYILTFCRFADQEEHLWDAMKIPD